MARGRTTGGGALAASSLASMGVVFGRQAIQLGFLPRMSIVHTAGYEIGQIYMPMVNWALACGTLAAVVGFGSSEALAGAFGIAVSLLTAITTLMATFVALRGAVASGSWTRPVSRSVRAHIPP